MSRTRTVAVLAGVLCVIFLYQVIFSAPSSFEKDTYIHVSAGDTLRDIAGTLQTAHVVRSGALFEVLARVYGGNRHAVAGEYYFAEPHNVFVIAKWIVDGAFHLQPIKVTLPEGTSAAQMADIFSARVPDFNKTAFLRLATPREGYLFPDTYFVYPTQDATATVDILRSNFEVHIQNPAVQSATQTFGKPLSSVIIMASLIEKEAPDTTNRRLISGILWKRLALGMPLQVDAVFPYIAEDKTRGAYDTYKNKGLPPGPITNPGVDAILAATTPTASLYLYYLSDKQGVFHYSATYAGHLENQKKYLP